MNVQTPDIDVVLLREHLVEVSEHEAELTDRVYESLFAKRPDAVELFGSYSRPSQQRMMTETFLLNEARRVRSRSSCARVRTFSLSM